MNGDFEAGNTNFTSDYAYSPSSNGTEGQYTVRSNPFPWNGSFISAEDHTPASILEFSIDLGGGNFVSLGTKTTNLALAGTWEFLSTNWNSGSNSSINLQLINRNTAAGGNDFAVDDITFSTDSQFPNPAPEPGTLALLGAGLVGLVALRRRRS